MASVVHRVPWIAEAMVRLHSTRLKDYEAVVNAFHKSFGASKEDVEELKIICADRELMESFSVTVRESTHGMATDLRVAMQPWETHLAAIDVPITFIHGSGDPWTPPETIEALAGALPHARVHVEDGKGQLLFLRGLGQAITRSMSA